jgi:hypothetical protein
MQRHYNIMMFQCYNCSFVLNKKEKKTMSLLKVFLHGNELWIVTISATEERKRERKMKRQMKRQIKGGTTFCRYTNFVDQVLML